MEKQNLYILITFVITLWLLPSCASRVETEAAVAEIDPAVLAKGLSDSENLFKQRADVDKLREAVDILKKLRNPDRRNYEVEWKFAKYNYFLGKQIGVESESEDVFETGRDAGRIASRIEPERPDGYFWYAANLGELAQQSPITVGLKSVDDIRAAMNKVIEIQPDYQGASAYDALGQLELKTRLTGGKVEKGVELLEKGMAVANDNSNIRLHLAEAYFAVHKDAQAKKQLDDLLKLKPHPDYAMEHARALDEAKKLLEKKYKTSSCDQC